jgi:hypothetical protein
VDGYGNLIAGRLRKLAAAGSIGTLPFSGHCDGAIHFYDGQVVYAESARTPGARVDAAVGTPLPGGPPLAALPPLTLLAAILAVTEPTVDAALELMSAESRYARFRPARVPAADPACGIPVDRLLAEVTRRQWLLRQLSTVVTADTPVARNPELNSPGVQISARQWAVLIRVRPGTTPRALAWELRRSVFSTTAEVYRLLVLRLLSAAGQPARAAATGLVSAGAAGTEATGTGTAGTGTAGTGTAGAGPAGGHGPALISFIRAVPSEPGVTRRPARIGSGARRQGPLALPPAG